MGTDFRQQKIDINKKLFTQSSKFSFIQAIRLLELNSKNKILEDKIRTRPRLSLDFPNSDIVDIKKENDFIKLTVTFMGLYGESSPLPTFYTETLLQEELNDKTVMRDFIDIFNIPIYQTYFQVWLKTKLGIRVNEFHDNDALNFLHIFSGLPKEYLRKKHTSNYSPLKYAGLNMQYPRSAEALRILISDIINNDTVEIIQCIKRMAPIPSKQYCSLGIKNSKLDEDIHLGDKIKDRMGKFRILIKNLSIEKFNRLLPNEKDFDTIVQAVKLYIGETLSWDMQLVLKEDEYEDVSLGKNSTSKLGLNTWLSKGNKTRTLILEKNQYKVG
jgi:type VI secretion system protein ImpH